MKLRNLNYIKDYLHKPQRDSVQQIHELYVVNSKMFDVPTARDLIIERLTFDKWFENEMHDLDVLIPFDENVECQELCKLINVNGDDLDISVIDDFLNNKKQRVVEGRMLTFKDYKLNKS